MKPRGEVLAVDERHDEVHKPVTFVDAINGNDVRMAELRGGLGLFQEPRPNFAAERELWREQFDRDVALQPAIFRLVDDSHPASADLTVELIVGTEHALDVRAQLSVRGRDDGIRHRDYPLVGEASGVVSVSYTHLRAHET